MDRLIQFLKFRIETLEKKVSELEQTVNDQNNYILNENFHQQNN